jgi:hypothetical protein
LDTLDATVNADGTGLVEQTNAIQLRIDGVGTSTMEQKFAVHTDQLGDLSNQYSVKIDNNGAVAGFGLSSTGPVGNITSEFIVNADRFAIVSNASNPNTATTPFAVVPAGTVDGVNIPAGVFMTDAFIRNGSIVSAKIGTLSADKITTGFINAARIQTNTIDASKIRLDNSTITSQPIGGVPTVIIKNLGVKTAQIDNLAVQTVKIDGNAVTIPEGIPGTTRVMYWNGGGFVRTVATGSINPEGGKVHAVFTASVKSTNALNVRYLGSLTMTFNGQTRVIPFGIGVSYPNLQGSIGMSVVISMLPAAFTGSKTCTVVCRHLGFSNFEISNCVLTLTGMKK